MESQPDPLLSAQPSWKNGKGLLHDAQIVSSSRPTEPVDSSLYNFDPRRTVHRDPRREPALHLPDVPKRRLPDEDELRKKAFRLWPVLESGGCQCIEPYASYDPITIVSDVLIQNDAGGDPCDIYVAGFNTLDLALDGACTWSGSGDGGDYSVQCTSLGWALDIRSHNAQVRYIRDGNDADPKGTYSFLQYAGCIVNPAIIPASLSIT